MRIEIFAKFSITKFRKQWFFHIKAGNNEIVAQSEAYTSKDSASSTANMLRKSLSGAEIVYL